MLGIVVALESEAEILLEEMETFRVLTVSGKTVHVGRAFGKDVALVVCGVGKVNAALGTQLLVSKFDAEKLFNFGVAGGLNDSTELCGVYQIKAAVQFDFDLKKKALGTADRFNDSPDDYRLLTDTLKADIRDMEGAAVVQAAYAAQLPVYSVKAISDVAGSGSTTEQYLKNKDKALQNLKTYLPTLLEEL